jgi:LysM repeat protein
MYKIYVDDVLLPIAPSKIEIKFKNQNKTVNLINDGEVNILKTPGLTEIEFDVLLPAQEYTFSNFEEGFKEPSFFLEKFEKLKAGNKPFLLLINRIHTNEFLFDTSMKVSLEDYTMKEDVSNVSDISVSLNFKQYREYEVKKLKVSNSKKSGSTKKKATVTKKRATSKSTPKTYTVKKGDNLWNICKKHLNDPTKCWEIAKKNNIKNPHLIYPGQVIKLG